mgnify:CR=1 FL=1
MKHQKPEQTPAFFYALTRIFSSKKQIKIGGCHINRRKFLDTSAINQPNENILNLLLLIENQT